MIRLASILTLSLLLTAAANAQSVPSDARDAASVIITLPDGSTEMVSVADDRIVRIVVRDGEVMVEERPSPGDRRAYAILAEGEIGRNSDLEDVEIRIDEVLARLPGQVRESLAGINLPRVRIEREVSTEVHRALAEAERRTRDLAAQLRRAERDGNDREVSRLRGELHLALSDAFDKHQLARQERAQTLRERQQELLEEARQIEEERLTRERNRDEIVERRLRELLGDRDELDW